MWTRKHTRARWTEAARAAEQRRTALVALPHVSNLLGGIVDLPAVVQAAHAVGARVVADGVAYAPHRAIDVDAWDVDWYVYSTYKVFGPHMAVLYGRDDALAERGPQPTSSPTVTSPPVPGLMG
ncbi:MAG: aminotransferase class V-fold PLP-dependent enzyme [bacterium]|nr:aminotransferase class V-fold PLP-dependent enzyme [bacterium]